MAAVEVDPVPWAMGGGAENSVRSARLATYAASGGAEGVILPGDLKVSPLDVPGAGVRITAGGALVRNRAQSGAAETFVTRVAAPGDLTGLVGTGSSGGRSDLIVSEVVETATDGRYHRIEVISGVPAGTRRLRDIPQYAGRSAEELARIDYPASTSTITAGMLTDLRRLAKASSWTDKKVGQPPTRVLARHASAFSAWPGFEPDIEIPADVTHVVATVTLSGMGADGSIDGILRAELGSIVGSDFIIDIDTAGPSRQQLTIGLSAAIPPALRGTTVKARVLGRLYPSSPALIGSNPGSIVAYDFAFQQKPE